MVLSEGKPKNVMDERMFKVSLISSAFSELSRPYLTS